MIEKSKILFKSGDFKKSIPIFEDLFFYTKNYIYIYFIAESYLNLEDYENALDFLTEYIESNESDENILDKINLCIKKLGLDI